MIVHIGVQAQLRPVWPRAVVVVIIILIVVSRHPSLAAPLGIGGWLGSWLVGDRSCSGLVMPEARA